MNSRDPIACVKVAACICAEDGIISKAELQKMFEILSERFSKFSFESFEKAIDDFFDSGSQIEEFLDAIDNQELRHFALRLSELSAAADGLDTRENVALEKAHLVWGIARHA